MLHKILLFFLLFICHIWNPRLPKTVCKFPSVPVLKAAQESVNQYSSENTPESGGSQSGTCVAEGSLQVEHMAALTRERRWLLLLCNAMAGQRTRERYRRPWLVLPAKTTWPPFHKETLKLQGFHSNRPRKASAWRFILRETRDSCDRKGRSLFI